MCMDNDTSICWETCTCAETLNIKYIFLFYVFFRLIWALGRSLAPKIIPTTGKFVMFCTSVHTVR